MFYGDVIAKLKSKLDAPLHSFVCVCEAEFLGYSSTYENSQLKLKGYERYKQKIVNTSEEDTKRRKRTSKRLDDYVLEKSQIIKEKRKKAAPPRTNDFLGLPASTNIIESSQLDPIVEEDQLTQFEVEAESVINQTFGEEDDCSSGAQQDANLGDDADQHYQLQEPGEDAQGGQQDADQPAGEQAVTFDTSADGVLEVTGLRDLIEGLKNTVLHVLAEWKADQKVTNLSIKRIEKKITTLQAIVSAGSSDGNEIPIQDGEFALPVTAVNNSWENFDNLEEQLKDRSKASKLARIVADAACGKDVGEVLASCVNYMLDKSVQRMLVLKQVKKCIISKAVPRRKFKETISFKVARAASCD
ncbi:Hypothetical predicted protein [Cloeon dipterum]|uniref:DUF4806 domain-containing protein n=1 Tax=Cloeon dipterum TaxID=197152 RepID=A0A8S1E430_9INSE|nr:Hypothetical predicted protein [Cloeon dipterum]